jgi:predicted metal-dependent peptidase
MVLLPTEMAENKPTIRVDCESTAPTTPGGFGQVLDAPEPEEDDSDTVAEQAREWKIAVEQSENVANLAGKLPAGVTRSLEQSEAAGVDWRELLRRAWSETIPSDYSWMPPNRRHIWAGLYLPAIRSEGARAVLSEAAADP